MKLRAPLAIAAYALAIAALVAAVECSYTRYRYEAPYYITARAAIYGSSSSNSYGYAAGETEYAACVYSYSSYSYNKYAKSACSCTGLVKVNWNVGETGDYIYAEAYWYFDPDFYSSVTAYIQGYCSC